MLESIPKEFEDAEVNLGFRNQRCRKKPEIAEDALLELREKPENEK
ncbi:hypothetical protein JXA31_09685 [Candidatus Bathyarchaeota archaeon]|nr:hypothetical protein [Candidatus Bathyarchaeota archaeon]